MLHIDDIDRRILAVMQQDATCTNIALAEQVGLTPSTCLRRVRRLRESGVIAHVVALVNPEAVGRGLTAVVTVELGHHGAPQKADFVRRLQREPSIQQAWGTTGEVDVILVLRLLAMSEYQGVIDRLFANDPLVTRFYTYVVVETYKETTALPL